MNRRSLGIIPYPNRFERAARDATAWLSDGRAWQARGRLADFDEPRTPLPWPLCARIIFIASGLAWAALVYVVVS